MTTTADRAIPKAAAKLRKEGVLVTLRRPIAVAIGPGATLSREWETTTGYALFLTRTARRRTDGSPTERSIPSTERQALLAAQGLTFQPENGHEIFVGTTAPDKPPRILAVDTLEPSGNPVLFTLTLGG